MSGGDTKRVNSANPLTPGAMPLDALAAAEQLYATHRLPCRYRLTPLADAHADAMLEERAFEAIDHSFAMVAALTPRPHDPGVMLARRATPAVIARAERLSERSDVAAAVQARLLDAIPGPIALASLEEAGEVVASGYASIGAGRAQLSDVIVAPAARGRGLGRRLVAGLLGWAHAQGCAEAMLQVLAGNVVARGLYRALGFVDAYPYHYRVRR